MATCMCMHGHGEEEEEEDQQELFCLVFPAKSGKLEEESDWKS